MIAHVVGSGPSWALWLTTAVMFGAGVGALAVRGRQRRVLLGFSLVGAVATGAVLITVPAAPAAPRGLEVRFAAPAAGATVASPVVIRACANGSAVPGPGRLLSISVDGRQVVELAGDTYAVDVAEGTHTLRIELLTSDHRQYAPPQLTDEAVTVHGVAPPVQPPRCPS